jgi:hypothetical protein
MVGIFQEMLFFEQEDQTDNERFVIVECKESCRLEGNVLLNEKPLMSEHIVELHLALFDLLQRHIVLNKSLVLKRKDTFPVQRAAEIVQIYQFFVLIDRI